MTILMNYLEKSLRDPKNENLTQFHMDITSSIQKVTEEIMIKLAKSIRKEFGIAIIYVLQEVLH